MFTLSIQHLKNRLGFLTGFGISPCLPLSTSLDSVLDGSRIQWQIYDCVLLMEIFDWGKLEYDPFLLQV